MDMIVTLAAAGGNRTYGVSSLSGSRCTRSAREAAPSAPELLEVAHTTAKNGVRRSMVKVSKTVLDANGIPNVVEVHLVLARKPSAIAEEHIDHVTDLLVDFFSDESRRDQFNNGEA